MLNRRFHWGTNWLSKDFSVGDTVIKYAREIGRIVQPVKAGNLVHTHNLKTKRWA
jgi:(2R)-sulfolactate sulfo-lyase subunit alpha